MYEKKYTEELIIVILKIHENGTAVKEIISKYNISEQTISLEI